MLFVAIYLLGVNGTSDVKRMHFVQNTFAPHSWFNKRSVSGVQLHKTCNHGTSNSVIKEWVFLLNTEDGSKNVTSQFIFIKHIFKSRFQVGSESIKITSKGRKQQDLHDLHSLFSHLVVTENTASQVKCQSNVHFCFENKASGMHFASFVDGIEPTILL